MRILIADDHAVFRRGLAETLGEAFSRVTFGKRNGTGTLEACAPPRLGCRHSGHQHARKKRA